jgi:two-component system sensor histidine kinase ChvG
LQFTGSARNGPRGETSSFSTSDEPVPRGPDSFRSPAPRPRRFLSPITRRIVLINLIGLIMLLAGVLVLNHYRAGLVDAERRSLATQGQIIAGALVESALIEPEGAANAPQFDREAATAILRRLGATTGTRVRLYDRLGVELLDTRDLIPSSQVETYRLPPPGGILGPWPALEKLYDWVIGLMPKLDLERYIEVPRARGTLYPEVTSALNGDMAQAVRVNAQGKIIVSAGVPVQRLKVVQGALLITTDENNIAASLRAERLQILQIALIALLVSALLSGLLSRAIGRPVRRLAQAAESVRAGGAMRVQMPRLDQRKDEIGELARSLGHMTNALYDRMDAIERFAADVAHELKNPLTSLRSAVETLERSDDAQRRARLLAIIVEDVRRIDRLITDIAEASRLDAELMRARMAPIDLAALLRTLVAIEAAESSRGGRLALTLDTGARGGDVLMVRGLESHLAQVFQNVIENALSFTPKDGEVRIAARLFRSTVIVAVDDDGLGIAEDSLEKIFERFYTARENGESFGKHSGLGLAIARQVVLAHGGSIHAENRKDKDGHVLGARFVISLPSWLEHDGTTPAQQSVERIQ